MALSAHGLLIAALLANDPAWPINKCTDATGKVTYQEKTCPPADQGEEIKIHDNTSHDESVYYGGGYSYGYGHSAGSTGTRGNGVIHTGPRGGRYTVGPSGHKNYIPRGKR